MSDPPTARRAGLLAGIWESIVANGVKVAAATVFAVGTVAFWNSAAFLSGKIKEHITESVLEDIQSSEKSKLLPSLEKHFTSALSTKTGEFGKMLEASVRAAVASGMNGKLGTVSVGSFVLDQTTMRTEMTLLHLPNHEGRLFINVVSLSEDDQLSLIPPIGKPRVLEKRGIFSVAHSELFTAQHNSQEDILHSEGILMQPDEKYFKNFYPITLRLSSKKREVGTTVKPAQLQYINISYPPFDENELR